MSSLLDMACKYFQETLQRTPKIMSYLLGRGLRQETILEMGIGFADGTFNNSMRGKGYNVQEILNSKLIGQDKKDPNHFFDFFSNRIIFPITVLGQIKYMAGRDMSGRQDVAKYKNIPLKNLYYINEELLTLSPQYVILTEGFMDCYMLVQAGFPGLGGSGCNMKRKDVLLKLMNVKTVFIFFDSEENQSGIKGSIKTAFALASMGHPDIRIVETPRLQGRAKTDINDIYLSSLSEENFAITINRLLSGAIRFNNSALHHKLVTDMANKQIEFEADLSNAEAYNIYSKYISFEKQIPGIRYVQGPCPIHEETKGSFTVYLDDMSSHCFGCGFHGNALDLEKALKAKHIQRLAQGGF